MTASTSASLLSSLAAALQSLPSPRSRRNNKHKRSWSMPSRFHTDFESHVAGKVERLQDQPCSSYYSADWLGRALQVALDAHSNLTEAHRNRDIDIQGMGCKWVNQHLEDMVHLLDVCNVLKDSISEIRKRRSGVQVAMRGLALGLNTHTIERTSNSLDGWMKTRKNKDTQSKLEKCMSTLRRMADNLNGLEASTAKVRGTARGESDEASMGMARDIHDAKAMTILACAAVVAAVSMKTLRIPSLKNSSLITLQNKLKQAVDMRNRSSSSSAALLRELERADITLGDLNSAFSSNTNIPLEVSSTNMALHDLDIALALLDDKVIQLFKSLISSRVALLNMLSRESRSTCT